MTIVIAEVNKEGFLPGFLSMEELSESKIPVESLERTLRETSRNISGVYWATCIYGIVVFLVLLLVFFLSSSSVISWDRRIILGAVAGVFLISSLALLYLSRKEGKLLIILCPIVTNFTGLAIGFCTWYL